MKNLINCPDCNNPTSKKAANCPNCGRQIRRSPINLLAAVILAIFLIIGIGWLIGTITESIAK